MRPGIAIPKCVICDRNTIVVGPHRCFNGSDAIAKKGRVAGQLFEIRMHQLNRNHFTFWVDAGEVGA